jgi:hypothetical protein
MFDEYGKLISHYIDFFPSTDFFGQSLITEILEPLLGEYKFLSCMAEEMEANLVKIDAALAEIRAMGN